MKVEAAQKTALLWVCVYLDSVLLSACRDHALLTAKELLSLLGNRLTQPRTSTSFSSVTAKMSSSWVVVHVSDVAVCFGIKSRVAVKVFWDCGDRLWTSEWVVFPRCWTLQPPRPRTSLPMMRAHVSRFLGSICCFSRLPDFLSASSSKEVRVNHLRVFCKTVAAKRSTRSAGSFMFRSGRPDSVRPWEIASV